MIFPLKSRHSFPVMSCQVTYYSNAIQISKFSLNHHLPMKLGQLGLYIVSFKPLIGFMCFSRLAIYGAGSEITVEGVKVLYSMSEQTSFTPPLLVSFTDRDLSVPRM